MIRVVCLVCKPYVDCSWCAAETDEFLTEMDEDVEGMQSTIYLLQQQLKDSKEQILELQTELAQLKNSQDRHQAASDVDENSMDTASYPQHNALTSLTQQQQQQQHLSAAFAYEQQQQQQHPLHGKHGSHTDSVGTDGQPDGGFRTKLGQLSSPDAMTTTTADSMDYQADNSSNNSEQYHNTTTNNGYSGVSSAANHHDHSPPLAPDEREYEPPLSKYSRTGSDSASATPTRDDTSELTPTTLTKHSSDVMAVTDDELVQNGLVATSQYDSSQDEM